jgi:putative transposase
MKPAPTATARDLAIATGLPRQTIHRRLSSVPHYWSKGRGGFVKKYFVGVLPSDLRIALAAYRSEETIAGRPDRPLSPGEDAAKELAKQSAVQAEKDAITRAHELERFNALPQEQQNIAYARKKIIDEATRYSRASGYHPRTGAFRSANGDRAFVEAFNDGKIHFDEDITKLVGSRISYATLRRWAETHARKGLPGLANKYTSPQKGKTTLSEEQKEAIIAAMCRHPGTSSTNIRRILIGRFGQAPSERVIARFFKRWRAEHEELWLYHTNPDEWRSKRMLAFGNASERVTRLNQLWEADSTPADLLLTDGRYSLIGMIDVYSRRLKLLVSKTSRAEAVIGLTRACLIEWGIPEVLKTDNGKDYVSNRVVSTLEALEVEQLLCTPFAAQEKPHIERSFRTFLHQLVELMPGFIGHSVAERKAIEARRSFADRVMGQGQEPVELRLTSEQLQSICNEWVNFVYHHDPHRGLNGAAPIDMVRHWRQPIRRISDTRALDMLLMPAPADGGRRVIGKKGIRVENRRYESPEFAGHVGERVLVLLDPADMGTSYIYRVSDDGARTFLCAAFDTEWEGIDRAGFASAARKHQTRVLNEGARELRRIARESGKRDAYQDYIDARRAQIDNVIELPKRETEHTTAATIEADKAVLSMKRHRRELDEIDEIIHDDWHIEEPEKPATELPTTATDKVVPFFASMADRYAYIRDRRRSTPGLEPAEWSFLDEYYQTKHGQWMKDIEGDLRKRLGPANQAAAQK